MELVMWSVLGIDATTDPSTIRKAYAAKLRTCRPDEDPEDFQRLREAYDNAISFTKGKIRTRIVVSQSHDLTPNKDVTVDVIQPKKRNIVQIMQPTKETIDEVINRMEELYSDFFKRIEIGNWKRILESDLFWDIEGKTQLRVVMLRFFSTHPVLPKSVWILMDREFGWTEYKDSMPVKYKTDYVVLNGEMDPRWDLDYTCFRKVDSTHVIKATRIPAGVKGLLSKKKGTNYDLFPDYAQIRWNLKNAIYNEMEFEIPAIYESAFRLFPDDPSLHKMYYEYKKVSADISTFGLLCDAPEYTIKKLRELCPDNPEYEIAEANYYLFKKNYKRAARLYSGLMTRFPCHLDIAYHYGIAIKNLGNYTKSRIVFQKIKKVYPSIGRAKLAEKSYLKDRSDIVGQLSKNALVVKWLIKSGNI